MKIGIPRGLGIYEYPILFIKFFEYLGIDVVMSDKSNSNILKEGINNIDNFKFEVIYTPGHTDDSICIYFKDNNIMFVGDFIFKNGIGRTDLGGSIQKLKQSLTKISKYDSNIKIYPGHGKESILGIELEYLLK